ncbi:MAG: right-handed parallel beta-helix repeat-containing protein [Phycisphaerales bacterium]|nr:right-handed parallel beta-helix repeat-containing protein [Phycisphaerales bacterium]
MRIASLFITILVLAHAASAQLSNFSGELQAFDFDNGQSFFGQDSTFFDGHGYAAADSDGGLDGGSVELFLSYPVAGRSLIEIEGTWDEQSNGAWKVDVGFSLRNPTAHGYVVETGGSIGHLFSFRPDYSSLTPGDIVDLGNGTALVADGDYVLKTLDTNWAPDLYPNPAGNLDSSWAHANGNYDLTLAQVPAANDLSGEVAAFDLVGETDLLNVDPSVFDGSAAAAADANGGADGSQIELHSVTAGRYLSFALDCTTRNASGGGDDAWSFSLRFSLTDANGPGWHFEEIGDFTDIVDFAPDPDSLNAGAFVSVRGKVLVTEGDYLLRVNNPNGASLPVAGYVSDPTLWAEGIGTYELQLSKAPHYVPERYATIQAAVDAACDYEDVLIGPGTYIESINGGGKRHRLTGAVPQDARGADATVIEAPPDAARTMALSGSLSWLTIKGRGVSGSFSSIRNCQFIDNSYEGDGGAVRTFGYESNAQFIDCLFYRNVASGSGGAVRCDSLAFPRFERCRFISNSASNGGAVSASSSGPNVPVFRNCLFVNNRASGDGGAIWLREGSAVNCTFHENAAGGEGPSVYGYLADDAAFLNCSFHGVGNEIAFQGGAPTVTYCNVQGGFPGVGNIDEFPRFIDSLGPDLTIGTLDDDHRLRGVSKNIDAGDNSVLLPELIDIIENPRFVDDPDKPDTGNGTAPIVDMGAFEYQACTADFDGDLDRDLDDLQLLLFHFGRDDVRPETRGDADGDWDVDLDDLQLLLFNFGTDC